MDIQELADIEQLKQLKYRYLRLLDTKEWDELAEVFTPEATAAYAGGSLSFQGRDEILTFLRGTLGPTMLTKHQCHHPELQLDGDTAAGRWYLEDAVLLLDHRLTLSGTAFYDDRYERRDGSWLIAHTGYQRVFEHTVSWDDLPSLTFTENRFA